MKRIIWIALCLLFFLGGFLFLYYQLRYKHLEDVHQDIYAYMPLSSGFVFESNQIEKGVDKLKNSNIIWSDMTGIPFWKNIDGTLDQLQKHSNWIEKIGVCGVQSSGRSFDFVSLLYCSKKPSKEFIQSFNPAKKISQIESYEDFEIYCLKEGKDALYYSIDQKIVCMSPNLKLLQQSLAASLDTSLSLQSDPEFNHAHRFAGNDLDGNLLMNFSKSPILFREALSYQSNSKIDLLKNMGAWMSLDLQLKPNLITTNGFIISKDAKQHALSVLNKQKPSSKKITHILPKQTFYYAQFNLTNFPDFLDQNSSLEDGLKNQFSKTFGEVFTLAYLSEQKTDAYKKAVVFELKSHSELERLIKQYQNFDPSKPYGFIEKAMGNLFSGLNLNTYKVMDHYVVFSEESSVLERFFNPTNLTKPLSKNLNYQNFEKQFSKESTFFTYLKPTANLLFLSEHLSEQSLSYIQKYQPIFSKCAHIGLQINTEEPNLFYTTIQVKYDPSEKGVSSLLWDLPIEAPVASKPFLLKNHYTQLYDIFYQDKNKELFLVSTTGKILWKKAIDEQIIGNIYQVDAYKNNKYQLLFSTQSAVHLIDRNGKYVDGYPINIKDKITSAGLQLMDYDNNKSYRMLIPCKNKTLLNYSINGESIKGWDPPSFSSNLSSKITLLTINQKDYLVCLLEDGSIYLLDRRGAERYKTEHTLPLGHSDCYVFSASTIEESFITFSDQTGVIHKLFFNGTKQTTVTNQSFNQDFHYVCLKPNKNALFYAFLEKNSFHLYDQTLENLFTYTSETGSLEPELELYFFKNQTYYGITNKAEDELVLLNQKGEMHDDFPLEGNSSFSIKDVNGDGQMDVITGTQNTLRVYSLSD